MDESNLGRPHAWQMPYLLCYHSSHMSFFWVCQICVRCSFLWDSCVGAVSEHWADGFPRSLTCTNLRQTVFSPDLNLGLAVHHIRIGIALPGHGDYVPGLVPAGLSEGQLTGSGSLFPVWPSEADRGRWGDPQPCMPGGPNPLDRPGQ